MYKNTLTLHVLGNEIKTNLHFDADLVLDSYTVTTDSIVLQTHSKENDTKQSFTLFTNWKRPQGQEDMKSKHIVKSLKE